MSSSDRPDADTSDTRTPAQQIPPRAQADASATSPVEMNTLPNENTMGSSLEQQETRRTASDADMPYRPMRTDTTTAIQASQRETSPEPPLPDLPLGASNMAAVQDSEPSDSGPVLMITILVMSGSRHPFNLDAKYLAKRNVSVQGNDPFNLSVYKVKELILREWRDDWEAKPASPSAIRLISFGKVLDDKSAMKDLKFNPKTANVVHMSIKPQDFMEDEDAKGSKATRIASRDGSERRSPGCRCIIM